MSRLCYFLKKGIGGIKIGPSEIYGLAQGVPLVGCRPCAVKDTGFAEYEITIAPREEMVILYRQDGSMFYVFERIPGFLIIKCAASARKELELRCFAVTDNGWKEFIRFGGKREKKPEWIIGYETLERIANIRPEMRTGWQNLQMELLLFANDAWRFPGKVKQKLKAVVVTILFFAWVYYCWWRITPQRISPDCKLFFDPTPVPSRTWDWGMRVLNDKSDSCRYGGKFVFSG